jgi:hypothetical protein
MDEGAFTRPPNSRKSWTTEDDDELRRRVVARQPPGAIAKGMGRTVDGIRGRAQQLRLQLPSSRQPWRMFARPSWWGLRHPGAE